MLHAPSWLLNEAKSFFFLKPFHPFVSLLYFFWLCVRAVRTRQTYALNSTCTILRAILTFCSCGMDRGLNQAVPSLAAPLPNASPSQPIARHGRNPTPPHPTTHPPHTRTHACSTRMPHTHKHARSRTPPSERTRVAGGGRGWGADDVCRSGMYRAAKLARFVKLWFDNSTHGQPGLTHMAHTALKGSYLL